MRSSSELPTFEVLSAGSSEAFRVARLVAHWAAQLPAAAGTSLALAAEDFSHTSLSWLEGPGVLAGVVLPDGRRAALDIRPLTLQVLGQGGDMEAELLLRGTTLREALDWLSGKLGGELAMPTHELPNHPVGVGAPVPDVGAGELEALARWFAAAGRVLDRVTALHPDAAEVRCWPHHFDIATLISLDPSGGTAAEEARSVGVGMTPGDGGVPVPYFYVTPWPYPPVERLPELAGGGHWNTRSWVGALLRGDEMRGDADDQREQVSAFVTSALDASITLLDSGTA